MCIGVGVDEFSISVRNGIATVMQNDVPRLNIPVVVMAELCREGMRQHRKEKDTVSETDLLARQWEDMAA